MTRIRPLVFACIAAFAAAAAAQESRQLNRIATPQTANKLAPAALPPGARLAATAHPVPAANVEAAVRQLAAAWNTAAMRPLLANNFYDKDRLIDALARVPRDARLRVVAVEGINTLSQWIEKVADGREQYVSRVSATVRTQVEYNDARAGFQRLDGTNELVLIVREPVVTVAR
jgi:hypothetical protein